MFKRGLSYTGDDLEKECFDVLEFSVFTDATFFPKFFPNVTTKVLDRFRGSGKLQGVFVFPFSWCLSEEEVTPSQGSRCSGI